jgi:hypothetical protein
MKTPQTPTKSGLFTLAQAADYLGLRPAGGKWLARTGRVPGLRVGRANMYCQADLDGYINQLHQKAVSL